MREASSDDTGRSDAYRRAQEKYGDTEFPDWIEPQAGMGMLALLDERRNEYIRNTGHLDEQMEVYFKRSESLVFSPQLRGAWLRVAEFMTSRWYSQYWFFIFIIYAAPKSDGVYETRTNAKTWKKKFDKKISDLLTHWEKKPDNLHVYPILHTLLAHLEAADKPAEIDRMKVLLGEAFIPQLPCGKAYIQLLQLAVQNTHYSGLGHKVSVNGVSADRAHFIRVLSARMKEITGEYKRELVLQFTNSLFESEVYDEGSIRSITKNMDASLFVTGEDRQFTEAEFQKFLLQPVIHGQGLENPALDQVGLSKSQFPASFKDMC